MKLLAHDHFALYVSDIERSTRWYEEVLGLRPMHRDLWWSDNSHFVGADNVLVALFQRDASDDFRSTGMPLSNHQALRVDAADFQRFKEHLARLGIAYREMDHTISRSIYFQDPDDYWIEITTYEVPDR